MGFENKLVYLKKNLLCWCIIDFIPLSCLVSRLLGKGSAQVKGHKKS